MKTTYLFLFLVLFVTFSFAMTPLAEEELAKAQESLVKVNQEIREIRDANYSVTRFADEYSLLRELYVSAYNLSDNNKPVDLRLFYERLDALEKTIQKSKDARDQLTALKASIDNASKSIDVTSALEIYNSAEEEYSDQRYEIAIEKIDAAYEKLVELQGLEAKANAAYEATRKNVLGFIQDNYQIIAIIIIVPVIIYLLFKKKINLFILNKKINSLNFEIDVLKDEIKKCQKDYFIDGKVSEEEYGIKVRMFSEKIRDLHGTLALYMEKKEAILAGKKQLNTKKQ